MHNRYFLLVIFLISAAIGSLHAQELNANVVVNYQNVQTTETRVFTDMQNAFQQFLNNRKWTDDTYAPEERINCNFVINIEQMPSVGNFQATVQVQSSRPVYGTSYESLMLNFADRDWVFQYVESQPLEFNINSYTNNITSLLAYYAYIILGMDYDSFSKLGGQEYFEKAQLIVTNAQQQGGEGWDQFGSNRRRNRYWLAENFINPQMIPVREGIYNYHRKGLDTFLENEEESRQNMLNAIKEIQKVSKIFPQSILLISFFDAKNDEIISTYSKGGTQIRRDAYNALVEINPTMVDDYSVIIK
ncbi:type IX secretion system protein PorD [Catalinimonas niigatensis]|uniref:type IX secretion system protein PorD n=1 Tax=Catalinimonas niigatensis TaxID=1397264 RepID=UPI002666B30F|nr:DUF4835 family protein [Catalinimonas niigatensis]WPP52479.1 DUF4835 family protein [Catalinimonas niigatensis]